MPPVQLHCEVLGNRREGAYHQLTLVAPEIAANARPGQFVAVSVGGAESAMLLRRAFSIHAVQRRGPYGGTVDVVYAVKGRGTQWLAERVAHQTLDVLGPLGRPFTPPRDPCSTLLVGGGYGAAPLFLLGDVLRLRGCRVGMLLGAASKHRLFGHLEAKRMSTAVAFTTDDGSFGERGPVTDVLPAMLDRTKADVVYACGPMPMLAAVAAIASARGLPSQVAVEEAMACGIGVCMTCVLPVVGDDGVTRMVRSCTEGPVFYGDGIRFDAIGTVPPDTWGASPRGEVLPTMTERVAVDDTVAEAAGAAG